MSNVWYLEQLFYNMCKHFSENFKTIQTVELKCDVGKEEFYEKCEFSWIQSKEISWKWLRPKMFQLFSKYSRKIDWHLPASSSIGWSIVSWSIHVSPISTFSARSCQWLRFSIVPSKSGEIQGNVSESTLYSGMQMTSMNPTCIFGSSSFRSRSIIAIGFVFNCSFSISPWSKNSSATSFAMLCWTSHGFAIALT